MLSLEKLHFEHHASMRQRSYLHRTLAGTKSLCCCLGSTPLNAYQSRNAGMSWQPADIDIFVLDECVLDDLCTDYAVHVCDPLGLRMVRCGRNWLCSMNDVEDIGSELEIPVDTTVETNHVIEAGMALSEQSRQYLRTSMGLKKSLTLYPKVKRLAHVCLPDENLCQEGKQIVFLHLDFQLGQDKFF